MWFHIPFFSDAWCHSSNSVTHRKKKAYWFRASICSYLNRSVLCLSSIRLKSLCFFKISLQLWLDGTKSSKHLEEENERFLRTQKKNLVRKTVHLHFAWRDYGLWVSDIIQLLTNDSFSETLWVLSIVTTISTFCASVHVHDVN